MITVDDVLRIQREQQRKRVKELAQIVGFWAAYCAYVFVLGYFWLRRIGAIQ